MFILSKVSDDGDCIDTEILGIYSSMDRIPDKYKTTKRLEPPDGHYYPWTTTYSIVELEPDTFE